MKDSVSRARFRVFVVDDHPIVRSGLVRFVDNEPDLMVCGEAEDETNALACIQTSRPDVVMTDLALKESSGLSLIRNLNALYPKLPILVLSMYEEAVYAGRALRAGAKGYLMKSEANDNVITAIRCLLVGQTYLSETIQTRMLGKSAGADLSAFSLPEEKLSDREWEVFQLIGQGMGTRQIAEQLHVCVGTVDRHRAEIKKKLGLASGTELLQHAIKWTGMQNQVRV